MLSFELRLGPLFICFSMGDSAETLEQSDLAAQVERADVTLTDPVPTGEPADRIGFCANKGAL